MNAQDIKSYFTAAAVKRLLEESISYIESAEIWIQVPKGGSTAKDKIDSAIELLKEAKGRL